jgi:hypothetical protein
MEEYRSSGKETSLDAALDAIDAQDDGLPLSAFLLRCLPHPQELQRLVDVFMDELEAVSYPLSSAPFHRSAKRAIQIQQRGAVQESDAAALAVTFGMLSIAALWDHHTQGLAGSTSTTRCLGRRWHHANVRAINAGEAIGRFSDYQIPLAWYLASRFSFVDRRVKRAWQGITSAVRAAQSLGMHQRQSSQLDQAKDCQAGESRHEEKRLLWLSLIYEERTLAAMLKLPSCFADEDCTHAPPPPSATLSAESAHFVKWRADLTKMMGKVLHLIQKGPLAGLHDILSLDGEICAFQNYSLPSQDLLQHFSFIPRFMIHSHCLQLRIVLLKPFFLQTPPRHAPLHDHFQQKTCWIACTEAACQDLTLRESFVQELPRVFLSSPVPFHLQDHILTPRWFASIVVCGSFLLTFHKVTTEVREEKEMYLQASQIYSRSKRHLERFLDLALQYQTAHDHDVILQGEANVVQMFLRRADHQERGREKGDRRGQSTSAEQAGLTERAGSARQHGTASLSSHQQQVDSDLNKANEFDIQAFIDSIFRSESLLDALPLPPASTHLGFSGAAGEEGVVPERVNASTNAASTFDDAALWER